MLILYEYLRKKNLFWRNAVICYIWKKAQKNKENMKKAVYFDMKRQKMKLFVRKKAGNAIVFFLVL